MPSTSFSGHETFTLRFLWLPKAVRAAAIDPSIFNSDEAIAVFGVGKNMVRAMKHWGLASGTLQYVEGNRGDVEPTPFGLNTFGEKGVDPYCERPETAWRLHWELCRLPDRATLWHYLFGHWRGTSVDPESLQHEIEPWLATIGGSIPSSSTLKRDFLCLASSYAPIRSAKDDPEDSAACPLSSLGLVTRSGRTLFFRTGRRTGLTPEVFEHAITDFWQLYAPERETISIDEVMKHNGSPGRIFLLSEDQAFELVDEISGLDTPAFRFDSTAGIQQLYRTSSLVTD
ncbi:MAG: DUF4007 family protein [Pseudomonadota bacterium]